MTSPATDLVAAEEGRDPPSAGRLVGREHRLAVRVYYEDTDFTGVVYHGNYLRYLERGRSDFLRLLGADHAALLERVDPMAFSVVRIELDFRKPARIDDALVVVTTFDRLHGARLDATQRVERGGAVITQARVMAVCIDLKGRPRRPPRDLAAAVAPFLVAAPAV